MEKKFLRYSRIHVNGYARGDSGKNFMNFSCPAGTIQSQGQQNVYYVNFFKSHGYIDNINTNHTFNEFGRCSGWKYSGSLNKN